MAYGKREQEDLPPSADDTIKQNIEQIVRAVIDRLDAQNKRAFATAQSGKYTSDVKKLVKDLLEQL